MKREVSIDLKDLACGLTEKDDILKVVGALYVYDYYGIDIEDFSPELEELDDIIYNDSDDLLLNIENTMANIDREYGEDESEEDYDDYDEEDLEDYDEENEEDYDEEYEEDSYWGDEFKETNINKDTYELLEKNRQKNEEYLANLQ